MDTRFDSIIATAAARWSVPFDWIKAVIGTEYSFNANAYRYEPRIQDESIGLMQLLTRTAYGLGFAGSIDDLYLPEINIDLGTKLLADLRDRFATTGDDTNDFRRVYSAYNSGRPDLWESSSQVRTNVERALDWLRRVRESIPPGAAAAAGGGVLILVLAAAWLLLRR